MLYEVITRTRAIAVLIEKYFAPNTVVQSGYPLDMSYNFV